VNEHNGQARLAGRVVAVTGGSGGIGRAVCEAAAREGAAAVVIVDIDADRVDQTTAALQVVNGGAAVLGLLLDVCHEADMAAMAREMLSRFGHIDALVACAGILRGRGFLPHPVMDVSLDEWNQVLDVNLTGTFLSNRAVLEAMITQRRGDIVNVSSTSGRSGRANDSAYCASKFGVIGFSEALAEEVRQFGVRVQTILPDAVDTPMWQQNGPIRPERALDPALVADLIVYLITLPEDAVMPGPVIAPFRTRKRVRSARREDAARDRIDSGDGR
jgi:3-oxoacyl-[acyl-carrier protein] reductase